MAPHALADDGDTFPSSPSDIKHDFHNNQPDQIPPVVDRNLEQLAIVGMACRLSGNVNTPDELWELISRGRTGWSEIPAKRFNSAAYYHPNPSKPGCANPIGGHFLEDDGSSFDAPFFNLSNQEAISMDPQQRLLLEATFEALENSGIPKDSVIGQNVAVFVGGSFADYEVNNLRDTDTAPMYQATGCAAALLANRISYYFDLRGPSNLVDTACSSSLTALHLASQSLRAGECSMAIVAGCHLNLLPDYFVTMSMSQLFNDEGRTYSFDHRGKSGFARGEGVGCVILKPLDAAIQANDAIRAVIVNTGTNQDGRTAGITNPNGTAQQQLIERVYSSAKLDPKDCGFVEAHGTGTKVGDPIEAAALHRAFGAGRTARQPLYIGSIKSNIGHLEGASGIVSVIKSAMMLDKQLILPNTNFEKANESIPLAEWNMKVPTSIRPWPKGKQYVSINNFGFGGANAHAVLKRAPLSTKPALGAAKGAELSTLLDQKRRLYVITGNDQEAVLNGMKDISVYLETRPEVFEFALWRNLAYTLGQRRSHLQWKVAVQSTSSDDLGTRLASGRLKPVRTTQAPRLGFVFTGQGAQWHAMGRELMEEYPLFLAMIKKSDKYLRMQGAQFSLIEELSKDAKTTNVDTPYISQPICTAVQIGLFTLMASWGIHPTAVVGHSSGEIAAAYGAGMLTLEAALSLAYHRGCATVTLKEQYPNLRGRMLAVGASREFIQPLLNELHNGYATIACVNSPASVTISGEEAAIDELQGLLDAQGTFNRKLRVDVAYHSKHMENVADDYREAIGTIRPVESHTVRFCSSLLGREAKSSELGPDYWVDNLVSVVDFSAGLQSLCSPAGLEATATSQAMVDALIEVGPHGALEGPSKDILKSMGQLASKISYSSTLVRNKDATVTMLDLAATCFMKGCVLDFAAINFPKPEGRVPNLLTDLPRYSWNHTARYWHESRIADSHRFKKFARNDILGVLADYSNEIEPTWRNIVRCDDMPWLRHHKMQGMSVFPIAGYLVMAMEAASQRAQTRSVNFDKFDIREVVTGRALLLDDSDVEVTISLVPQTEGTRSYSDVWDSFRICSWTTTKGWTEHCRGLIAVRKSKSTNNVVDAVPRNDDVTSLKSRITQTNTASQQPIDAKVMYQTLAAAGVGYGPTFQSLENCQASKDHSVADIIVPDTAATMPHGYETPVSLHPTFFDHFIQLVWPILGAGRIGLDTLYMPSSLKRATISYGNIPNSPGDRLRVYCTGEPTPEAPKPTKFSIFATAIGNEDEALISFEDLIMTPILDSSATALKSSREICYRMTWEPAVPVLSTTEDTVDHSEKVETQLTDGLPKHEEEALPNGTSVDKLNHQDEKLPLTNGVSQKVTDDEVKPLTNGTTPHEVEHVNDTSGSVAQVEPQFSSLEFALVCSTKTPNALVEQMKCKLLDAGARSVSVGNLSEITAADKICVVLAELDEPFLANIEAAEFGHLQKMINSAKGILWVVKGAYQDSQSPSSNMVTGLARSVRSETLLPFVVLDVDVSSDQHATVSTVFKVLDLTWHSGSTTVSSDMEYMERKGEILIPRIVSDQEMDAFLDRESASEVQPYLQPFHQTDRRLKVAITIPGALDTIHFIDDPNATITLPADDVEIQVEATGMNFKDVIIMMGQLPNPGSLGVECSGVVTAVGSNVTNIQVGQRVMAMSIGAYATHTRCPATSACVIPDEMSFVEAATIPVVFCTAYYSLFDLGRLEEGESVLIHAAAGGVGQAAILLAKHIGAEIFATVSSAEKKQFLMTTYGIPSDRIFYSRDISFGADVRSATNGRGVDVVLNSLAGDLLRETWECLAHFGRFIEIGKRDITANTGLGMAKFDHNATFASVDLTVVAAERPKLMAKLMSKVVELLRKDAIKPIAPITTYTMSKMESALRSLQGGKAMGKIVVVAEPNDQVKVTHRKTSKTLFAQDATYLIVGGTGGLGRSMARWMSEKGAGHIMLVSRKGKITGEIEQLISDVALNGTKIHVAACDVGIREQVERLINVDMAELPKIQGVILATMVLADQLFEGMPYQSYASVVHSKVPGASYLHDTLLTTPLSFFILLSSTAGIVGNRGQTAYAAANTFLDAFAQYRRSLGLPATSICLTAVSGVGYLADNSERLQDVAANMGDEMLVEAEVLALIHAAVDGKMESCNGHCITGVKVPPGGELFWTQDKKFAPLVEAAQAAHSGSSGAAATVPLAQQLDASPSPAEALQKMCAALTEKLSAVLMMPVEEMDPSQPVSAYGLDSLSAIEIRNWITREVDVNVQVLELLASASMTGLAEKVLGKSRWAQLGKKEGDA